MTSSTMDNSYAATATQNREFQQTQTESVHTEVSAFATLPGRFLDRDHARERALVPFHKLFPDRLIAPPRARAGVPSGG